MLITKFRYFMWLYMPILACSFQIYDGMLTEHFVKYGVGQKVRPQIRGHNSVESQPIYNFFTGRFHGKFAVNRLLKPHHTST